MQTQTKFVYLLVSHYLVMCPWFFPKSSHKFVDKISPTIWYFLHLKPHSMEIKNNLCSVCFCCCLSWRWLLSLARFTKKKKNFKKNSTFSFLIVKFDFSDCQEFIWREHFLMVVDNCGQLICKNVQKHIFRTITRSLTDAFFIFVHLVWKRLGSL